MSRAYLVAEGKLDIQILQRLLPGAAEVTFVDGRGTYGAESLARSLAATRDLPVALVIDADTTSEVLIAQKQQDLMSLVGQVSLGAPFEVFQAVPSIETLFFADRSLFEQLIERQLTDLEWQLGQRQPKELLDSVVGDSAGFVQEAIANLSESQLKTLRQHPLIQRLTAFLALEAQAA